MVFITVGQKPGPTPADGGPHPDANEWQMAEEQWPRLSQGESPPSYEDLMVSLSLLDPWPLGRVSLSLGTCRTTSRMDSKLSSQINGTRGLPVIYHVLVDIHTTRPVCLLK